MNPLAYYSREDIQNELVRIAKNREIQIWYGKDQMGKRPDTIQFKGDLKSLIKNGMTSLHVSEERWRDPLMLKPGMNKKDLNDLRLGWDLVLDLDGKDFEFSKLAGELILDVLEFYDVKNISQKFSGNKGFHIAVPFEAFPEEVNGIHIKDYFPEGLRTIAEFIAFKIKPFLEKKIFTWKDIDTLAVDYFNGDKSKMYKGKEFNPFSLIDIDSILISSRHLFRAPYVFNEKSGLVSIVVKDLKNFKRDDAKPEKVIVDSSFLSRENIILGSARQLLVEAFDWATQNKRKEDYTKIESKNTKKTEFETPKIPIGAEFFPPCINKLLEGITEDGRKRGVFILINFLRTAGWSWDGVEVELIKWNEKAHEPLREGYIKSQISWAKKQNKLILPPNCNNESYYKAMNICCPDNFCKLIKNPVNYTRRKLERLRKKN